MFSSQTLNTAHNVHFSVLVSAGNVFFDPLLEFPVLERHLVQLLEGDALLLDGGVTRLLQRHVRRLQLVRQVSFLHLKYEKESYNEEEAVTMTTSHLNDLNLFKALFHWLI